MLQEREPVSEGVSEETAPPKEPVTGAEFADGLTYPRRFWAIAAISFGTSLFVIDGAVANVALPTIAEDLGVSSAMVTNVATVYQLVMVMVLLPFATVGDRIGHRNLYQLGQILFCISSAAAFLVTNFWILLLVRAAQAVGAGIALSVSAAMLRSIYPAKNLGSGLGINSVIVASSYAVAPTLGGFITEHLDWRWVFVAGAPLALLSLALGRSLPDPEPKDIGVDVPGGVWSAATVLLLIGGLAVATHGSIAGWAMVGAGAVSGCLLARRESRRQRPVLPVDLMSRPAIGLSVLAAIAAFIASSMLIVALPFRFEQGMGYSPQQVGLLIAPYPLTMLVVAPAAGWLSDRISPSVLGMGGMVIAVAGLLLLAGMPDDAGVARIAWRLSLTALGFGLFLAPNSRLMIGTAPKDRSAAAGGLLSTSRLFGQSTGAALVGVLLAAGLGLGPVSSLVAAGLCVLAGVLSGVRFKATGANLRRKRPA
jgi:DHA2 family multidrug resistance protein-like MFS transporter